MVAGSRWCGRFRPTFRRPCRLFRRWRGYHRQMSQTVAEFILARLRQWHVPQVFGYPGDGINGLVAAFGKDQAAGPQFVQTRHEEMAALAATGYAKFSGHIGVCMATSGPGAIHLLNGLYDAKLDHTPVVAIVGQTARSAMGGSYQQEVDLQALFSDVASDFLVEVNVASQLPNALDRAFRTARARRAPTAVVIPSDLQEQPYEPPGHAFKQVPSSGPNDAEPVAAPDPVALQTAADILNAGSKVAILIGQGARSAADEVAQVAELTGAGVAKALLGKDVLPDDLPYVTGAIGLLGTRPSYDLMRECDTLLIVGSNFPYSQFLPGFGQARAVEIDIDGANIGMRYPTEVNIVADAKTALGELIPLLTRKSDRSWRSSVRPVSRGGGKRSSGSRCCRRIRSTRCVWCGSCRPGCPTTRSSPGLPGPRPIGMPAVCVFGTPPADRCRARWRPWVRRCRTRSAPSSPSRIAR